MARAVAGGVDPALLAGWLRGRSLARRLPAPVADGDGWRVDTASAVETRRYVFASPSLRLRALAEAIAEPRIGLKLCAEPAVLLALLPPRWILQSPAWLMTHDRPPHPRAPLPNGFRLSLERHDAVLDASILSPDGSLAASGHAAAVDGYYVFDRIVTQDMYRRRGLGRALMSELAALAPASARQVLTATEMGRALYLSLGWEARSPYSTALIPG